jgi:hypothetical protein
VRIDATAPRMATALQIGFIATLPVVT